MISIVFEAIKGHIKIVEYIIIDIVCNFTRTISGMNTFSCFMSSILIILCIPKSGSIWLNGKKTVPDKQREPY